MFAFSDTCHWILIFKFGRVWPIKTPETLRSFLTWILLQFTQQQASLLFISRKRTKASVDMKTCPFSIPKYGKLVFEAFPFLGAVILGRDVGVDGQNWRTRSNNDIFSLDSTWFQSFCLFRIRNVGKRDKDHLAHTFHYDRTGLHYSNGDCCLRSPIQIYGYLLSKNYGKRYCLKGGCATRLHCFWLLSHSTKFIRFITIRIFSKPSDGYWSSSTHAPRV